MGTCRWEKRREKKQQRKWYRFCIFDLVLFLCAEVYIRILFLGIWTVSATQLDDAEMDIFGSSWFFKTFPHLSQSYLMDLKTITYLIWVLFVLGVWYKIRRTRQSYWMIGIIALIIGYEFYRFTALVWSIDAIPYR